jgi:REP element-mobilizing transposase RayT
MGSIIKELSVICAVKNNIIIKEMECDKDHIHLLISYLPTINAKHSFKI